MLYPKVFFNMKSSFCFKEACIGFTLIANCAQWLKLLVLVLIHSSDKQLFLQKHVFNEILNSFFKSFIKFYCLGGFTTTHQRIFVAPKNSSKILFTKSCSTSVPINFGLLFYSASMFLNEFVIVEPYLVFKGTVPPFLQNISLSTETHQTSFVSSTENLYILEIDTLSFII